MEVRVDTYITIAEALKYIKNEIPKEFSEIYDDFSNLEQSRQEYLLKKATRKINKYIVGIDCDGLVFPLSFQSAVPEDVKIAQALEAAAMYQEAKQGNSMNGSESVGVVAESEKTASVTFLERHVIEQAKSPFVVPQIINMLSMYKRNKFSTLI